MQGVCYAGVCVCIYTCGMVASGLEDEVNGEG